MSNLNNYVPTEAEFLPLYNQVRLQYENSKGLVHAVMKDSVQNCFGHRVDVRHANNWGMEYSLIENPDQTLLTITDYGTEGLTGLIYTDINDRDVVTPELRSNPEERLARIERVLNEGVNVIGASGSKGRGMLTTQFNSTEDKIMWDSLRSTDNRYVANHRKLENGVILQLKGPKTDREAHDFIQNEAGLQPLDRPGTRITIFSPSEQLIEAIKDGTFAKYIGDTWFELLGKHRDNIDGIHIIVNGEKTTVKLPEHWRKYFIDGYSENQVFRNDNINVTFQYVDPDDGTTYNQVSARIAQAVYAIADEDLDEDQRGIVVNRKYMPINQIHPILTQLDLPSEYSKKVFGYVKLDHSPVARTGKSYEDMIKSAEDDVHYSFSRRSVYGNLQRKIVDVSEEFKRRAGITTRSAAHIAQQRREAAKRAARNINNYFSDLGVSGAGSATGGSKFIVGIAGINYPGSTSEVLIGQSVKDIKFKLKNRTPNNQTVKLFIETLDKHKHTIELISDAEDKMLASYSVEDSESYIINLSENIYAGYNYSKIYIRASIIDNNGDILASKSIPLYLGIDIPESTKKPIVVYEPFNLPNDNDRVNINDMIENVSCLVKNDTDVDWALKLKVAVHDSTFEEDIDVLKDYKETFILAPHTEEIFPLGNINFDEESYGHIDEGKLILRAQLVSAIDQNEKEENEKLSQRKKELWLNMDPVGKGLFKIDQENNLSSEPRCKVEGDNGSRTLVVNLNHPHFKSQETTEDEENYYAELCILEGLRYCWENGYEQPFSIAPNDEVSSSDAVREIFKALDKGLEEYHGG